ncbi:hypothetical protein DICPUDRAFT_148331 [Dictyostelium purpureum]|uniref:Uncharacterized protein n=1 Tax=Dictyostelium purpureum TaxID=5786 RepID=F0ZAU7_DICPU|nr:uncharacterized protein DICPUDRAFT_148331 [Dictyostelium purpureum]EGC38950.1 hypothetical protein DICPUDRAFT_148331 [Dictyostelium purpureum]|eukprot:XP_003284515.1 hypothetical protein DICPUDRAFT_148331 [Dictyostelium purpureum]
MQNKEKSHPNLKYLSREKVGAYTGNNNTNTNINQYNNNIGSSFKTKAIPTITNPILKPGQNKNPLQKPSLPSKISPQPIQPIQQQQQLQQPKQLQLPQPTDISQQLPQQNYQFSSPINQLDGDSHQNFFIQTPSKNTSPHITSQNLFPSAPQQPMTNIKATFPPPKTNKTPPTSKQQSFNQSYQQLPQPTYQKQNVVPFTDQDNDCMMDNFISDSDFLEAFKPPPQPALSNIKNQSNNNKNNLNILNSSNNNNSNNSNNSNINNNNNNNNLAEKYELQINQLKASLVNKEKEYKELLEKQNLIEREREQERKKEKEKEHERELERERERHRELERDKERQKEREKEAEREKEKKLEKRKAEIDIQSENAKKLKSESLINVQNNIQKEKIILDEIMDDISILNPFFKPKPTFNKELHAITKKKAMMNEQRLQILQLFSFKNGSVPSIIYLLPSNFNSPFIQSNHGLFPNPTPLLLGGNSGGISAPQIKPSATSQTPSSKQQKSKPQPQIQPQPQPQPQQQPQQQQQQQQPQEKQSQQPPPLPQQKLPKPEMINDQRSHPNDLVYNKTPFLVPTPSNNTQRATQTQRSKSNLEPMFQSIVLPPQFCEDLSQNISNVLSLQRPCCSLFKSLLPFLKLNSVPPIEKALDVIITLLINSDECLNFFVSDLSNTKFQSSSLSQITSTLISQQPINTQPNQNPNLPSTTPNKPHYLTLPNNQTANLYPIPNLVQNPRIFSLSPITNIISNNNNNNNDNNNKLKEKDNKEIEIVTLSNNVNISSNSPHHEDTQIIKYLIENFNNILNLVGNNKSSKIIDNILTLFILVIDNILSTQPPQPIYQQKQHQLKSNIFSIDNPILVLQKFDSVLQQPIIVQMFSNSTTIEQKTLFIEFIERFLGQSDLVTLLIAGGGEDVNGFFVKAAICLGLPISNSQQCLKLISLKLKIVKLLAKAVMIYKKLIGALFRDIIFQAGIMLISDIFNNALDLNLFEENEQQKQSTTLIKETLKLIYSWFNKFTENISLKGSEKEIDLLKATTLRISKYNHINSLIESILLCENLVEFIDSCETQINQQTNTSTDQSTNESDNSSPESNNFRKK